ncbi:MAG: spore coat U domain-containing protein [Pseudomonadota bacterium]
MSWRTNSRVSIGVAAAAVMAVGSAHAQSVQDQKLLVQAFIGEVCIVTSAALDFGTGVNTLVNNDADGTIDIECAVDTDVDIELDGGLKPAGNARSMTGAANDLLYLLYKDPGRSDAWAPNGVLSTTINAPGASVPVYGRVPAQPNGHAPGLHTDEVTITLLF